MAGDIPACASKGSFDTWAGGKVAREPGPVKGGKTVIAFVEDPTGYKWELIERQPPVPEPVAQVLWNCTSQHRVLLCIRATPGPPCAWAPPVHGHPQRQALLVCT